MAFTDEQYEVLKEIALELFGKDGPYDRDKFIVEIKIRQTAGTIVKVFTATAKQIRERYERELIHAFFVRWETERFKSERRRIVGTGGRVADVEARYEMLNGDASEAAKAAALAYYRQGVTLIGRYSPYLDLTDAAILADIIESREAQKP